MTDQSLPAANTRQRPLRSTPRATPAVTPGSNTNERKRGFIASLDKPLLVIVMLLVVTGMMMVFSTTFDWSNADFGSPTAIFVERHLRNVIIAVAGMIAFAFVDYRFWKRFAVWLLLLTIGALIAVLVFGDDTFGARRSLIGGSFQPGELAEFTIIVYMAAWLGSKKTKVASITFGLIPFGVLVAIIGGLIILQPDYSSAVVVVLTAGTMYFLAGARILHLMGIMTIMGSVGLMFVQSQPYAQARVADYAAALQDPRQASYHTQQAIISFVNGGWSGVGLGQGERKFGSLPAPHTDSIFAVIGEELGVLGASSVVLMFIVFAIRGFQIARRAVDSFGALLAIGFTIWVLIQALLNIAVMTALVPSTGVPLPFISFGGSSLLVLMIGVGLMLSIQRVSSARQLAPDRRNVSANYDRGWGNRRTRLSRSRRRRSRYPAASEQA